MMDEKELMIPLELGYVQDSNCVEDFVTIPAVSVGS